MPRNRGPSSRDKIAVQESKSDRERQAERRKKMREAGYVRTNHWVHRDDQARLKRYVERLNAARRRKGK